jgi:hypothetical protein
MEGAHHYIPLCHTINAHTNFEGAHHYVPYVILLMHILTCVCMEGTHHYIPLIITTSTKI